MANLTYAQYVAMTIAANASGTLSLIGSSLILFVARNKWKEPLHRIVSWLSVTDIVFTLFGVYAQVWFAPQDSPINLYWARGNRSTCTFVGAISSWLRLAGSILNCSLSIYFLLFVRYGWRNNEVIRRRMEFPAYAIAVFLPSLLMVVAIRSDSYAVAPLFNHCLLSRSKIADPECFTENPSPDCQVQLDNGGRKATIASLSAFLIVAFTLIGFICTFLVNWGVRRQMRLSRQSSMTGLSSDLATEVAWQSIWYSLAYFNTFIWPILIVPILLARQFTVVDQTGDPGIYMLSFAAAFCLPLQGALNCIVYLRPQYRQWLKVSPPGTSRWEILRHILVGTDLPLSRNSRFSRLDGGRSGPQTSTSSNRFEKSPSLLTTNSNPPPPSSALGEVEEGKEDPLSSSSMIRLEEENDGTKSGNGTSSTTMMTTTTNLSHVTFTGEINCGVQHGGGGGGSRGDMP